MKRIIIITGHYGSGKTEFAVNMAINLRKEHDKVALLDMDIANPYFRSRERQKYLENLGIVVHHNSYGYDLSLIHISEPTRLGMISYAVFCLKKKKKNK